MIIKSLKGPGHVLIIVGMAKEKPVYTKLAMIATMPEVALLLISVRYKFYTGSCEIPTTRVNIIENITMPVLNSVTSEKPIAILMRPAEK